MSQDMWESIWRVVSGAFIRSGGTPIGVGVRGVLATSNCNLLAGVVAGKGAGRVDIPFCVFEGDNGGGV